MNAISIKRQSKEIIDHIPDEKLNVVFSFLRWVEGEDITTDEWATILQGEKEIKNGDFVSWREVARTL